MRGWVIEEDWVTREAAEEMVEQGYWHLPGGVESVNRSAFSPSTGVLAEITGRYQQRMRNTSLDDDENIRVWHYWQSDRNGQDHAYGCVLGEHLVYYGPNPQPYKGIPYRGKSYLRDPHRIDGISLANQHRHSTTWRTPFWTCVFRMCWKTASPVGMWLRRYSTKRRKKIISPTLNMCGSIQHIWSA
jgi:hypothetical protein